MSIKPILFSAAILAASLSAAAPAQAGTESYLGEITLVGFNFCPRGTAQANGQLLAIAQNTALFSLYGTTYGGDGRTTFALPDLRGRTVIGEGKGPGLSERRLGQKTGSETTYASPIMAAKGDEVGAAAKGKDITNMQPSIALKYCVTMQGIYPSRS